MCALTFRAFEGVSSQRSLEPDKSPGVKDQAKFPCQLQKEE